jgi:hypothetical protein
MSRVAVMTDSNSGITQAEAREMGITVLPMPFYIDEKMYYEDIDLSQEEFYERLKADCEIKTSMPIIGNVTDAWDKLLKEYDEVVYIPMSSGLSSSCETAYMLSQDYDGKVEVVDNQRISITQRQSVLDAMALAKAGKSAAEIKQILLDEKFESSIYIMLGSARVIVKVKARPSDSGREARRFRKSPHLKAGQEHHDRDHEKRFFRALQKPGRSQHEPRDGVYLRPCRSGGIQGGGARSVPEQRDRHESAVAVRFLPHRAGRARDCMLEES